MLKKPVTKKYKYKKKVNGKNATGKPPDTVYDPIRHPRAVYLLCLAGFTGTMVWESMRVTKLQFYDWKKQFPEFGAAIKDGRDAFDSGHVENALLERALGAEYDEVCTEEVQVPVFVMVDGKRKRVMTPAVRRRVTRKKIIPDVTAIMFWLQNRNPERWKNVKYLQSEIKGALDVTPVPYDLKRLEKRELEQFRKHLEHATIDVKATIH